MTTTIKDIARMSGVSTATVSRVINQQGGYSSEIKARVLQVIEQTGYRRNEQARNLVQQASRTIGIIMPHMTTSFYGKIVSAIEDEATLWGYSVIITHAGVDGIQFRARMGMMMERRVAALMIFSMTLSKDDIDLIKDSHIPVLLIATEAIGTRLPYIKIDDYAAAFTATSYLIEQGHQHIGMIGFNPQDAIAGRPRYRGFLDAMEEHGFQVDEDWIAYGDFSFNAGREGLDLLMKAKCPVTAVFCASDEVAMGVIHQSYRRQIQIPKDLSVIGFDNSEVAKMATPALTTVSQPFYEMGRKGCKRILASLQRGEEMISQIIPYELIERETVFPRTREIFSESRT